VPPPRRGKFGCVMTRAPWAAARSSLTTATQSRRGRQGPTRSTDGQGKQSQQASGQPQLAYYGWVLLPAGTYCRCCCMLTSGAALLPSILPLSLPVLYCLLALARQPGWRFVASIDYLVLLSTRRLDGMCFVS
jgi:hypothetical protein